MSFSLSFKVFVSQYFELFWISEQSYLIGFILLKLKWSVACISPLKLWPHGTL